MNAESMLNNLRKRAYLHEYSVHGNKKVWFSTSVPPALPIGPDIRTLIRKEVPLPHGHYSETKGEVAGWMSYWRHFGAKCSSATAFVSILPLHAQQPLMHISRCEPMPERDNNGGRYQFGLSGEWLAAFNIGIEQGLQTVLSHPLADVEVRILNAIVDGQESDLKAFEGLGRWLTEQLTIELYRERLIERD